MSLRETIKHGIKEAMRNKDSVTRDTLRNIDTAIKQIEVDNRVTLDDEAIVQIIAKYAKQRHEAKEQFLKAKRDDLVAKEDAELAIIEPFLPKQLSDDELTEKIKTIIASCGATSMKDMGKVMGIAKSEFGNSADGSRINTVVKTLLQ